MSRRSVSLIDAYARLAITLDSLANELRWAARFSSRPTQLQPGTLLEARQLQWARQQAACTCNLRGAQQAPLMGIRRAHAAHAAVAVRLSSDASVEDALALAYANTRVPGVHTHSLPAAPACPSAAEAFPGLPAPPGQVLRSLPHVAAFAWQVDADQPAPLQSTSHQSPSSQPIMDPAAVAYQSPQHAWAATSAEAAEQNPRSTTREPGPRGSSSPSGQGHRIQQVAAERPARNAASRLKSGAAAAPPSASSGWSLARAQRAWNQRYTTPATWCEAVEALLDKPRLLHSDACHALETLRTATLNWRRNGSSATPAQQARVHDLVLRLLDTIEDVPSTNCNRDIVQLMYRVGVLANKPVPKHMQVCCFTPV